MYEGGQTLEQVAKTLSSDEWQPYWRERLGREYRPSAKVVNKVAKRHGFVMRNRGYQSGAKHHLWKGGRTTDKAGYVLVWAPDHPFANRAGYVREHRLVAEEKLGRLLLPTEVVHHIDDDPSNNSPENLVVFESNGQHLAATRKGRKPNISPEGRERIRAANLLKKGKVNTISPEGRERMRQATIRNNKARAGKKRQMTPEQRERNLAALDAARAKRWDDYRQRLREQTDSPSLSAPGGAA